MTAAEQLTDPVSFHAEGAVWDAHWGGLKWVDMFAGDILSLDATSGVIDRLHVGSPIAAMVRPRVGGGFVVATEREFGFWGEDGAHQRSTPTLLTDEGMRFNEGGCDPAGRFLCGSMSRELRQGAGGLYRMDREGEVTRLFGDVTVSNGLGFTGSGRSMYYTDTATRRIDVLDVGDDGELRDRRPFVSVEEGVGYPDGLWVDELDGVWVALYGGSAVRHYSAEGRLEDVIEVGASNVTSCTFGGPQLDTLFITTTRENVEPGDQPSAGALFTASAGVRGLAVLPYDG